MIKKVMHSIKNGLPAILMVSLVVSLFTPFNVVAASILTDFNTSSGWTASSGLSDGTSLNGWKFNIDSSKGGAIKILDQGNGDNCLNVVTSSTHSGWPTAQYNFSSTTQRVTDVEFKTYFAMGSPLGYTVQLLFDNAPNDNSSNFVDIMTICATPTYSTYEKVSNPPSVTKILSNLGYDTYSTFTIRYDNNSNGLEEKKLYIYNNGLCLAAIKPDAAAYAARKNIKAVRFTTTSTATNANFRIDDVKVSDTNYFKTVNSCGFDTAEGWSENTGFANPTKKDGWTFSKTNGYNSVLKIANEGNGDNCLNITTPSDTNTGWPICRFDFTLTTKRFTDIELSTFFAIGHNAGFTIGAMFNDGIVNGTWTDLLDLSATGIVDKITTGTPTIASSAINNGTYSKINIRYDNNSDGAGTKKIYIYKDNAYLTTITPTSSFINKTGIVAVRFNMVSTAKDADYRIDDVYISETDKDYSTCFMGENGLQLQTLASGTNTARVQIANQSLAESMPVTIILAAYNADGLVKISSITDVVNAGANIVLSPSIICNGTESAYKVFVWNGFNNITPYDLPDILINTNSN